MKTTRNWASPPADHSTTVQLASGSGVKLFVTVHAILGLDVGQVRGDRSESRLSLESLYATCRSSLPMNSKGLLTTLLILLSTGSTALATPLTQQVSCRAAFASINRSYIDLSPSLHSEAFIEKTRELRAEVVRRLGFLPDIKRTQLTDIGDIKLFLPGAEPTKENAIAYSSYRSIKGKTLEVEMTWVREDFREMGLSKLLFSEILAQHPEIRRIHVSDLVDTNLELFEKARETLGKKKSLRTLPLYRKYAAFGFTEIKKLKIMKMKTHSMSLGGKEYELVTQNPAIEFDLVRSK